ncbi:hypothetical protein L596_014829 [Steinernema carpocapsae]|uniref:Uncharacterized protein n=1 Tax=Steinernema carpocapsae TaxID=34508 RepID=A0A4U5ND07_STECR|nr:hypothetical protein L596_014829 [Steinernema carpocapsae]
MTAGGRGFAFPESEAAYLRGPKREMLDTFDPNPRAEIVFSSLFSPNFPSDARFDPVRIAAASHLNLPAFFDPQPRKPSPTPFTTSLSCGTAAVYAAVFGRSDRRFSERTAEAPESWPGSSSNCSSFCDPPLNGFLSDLKTCRRLLSAAAVFVPQKINEKPSSFVRNAVRR